MISTFISASLHFAAVSELTLCDIRIEAPGASYFLLYRRFAICFLPSHVYMMRDFARFKQLRQISRDGPSRFAPFSLCLTPPARRYR